MRKTFCSVMLCMAGLLTSSMARADAPAASTDPAAAPPTTTTAVGTGGGAEASKMRLGVTLVPMPLGSLKGGGASLDTAFAFGVMPVFDYLITPNFFVGIGPSYTLNVKAKDFMGDASKELDLLLRIGGGVAVGEKVGIYGYASPGYSIVSPSEGDSAKGLVVGLHAGGMLDVTSTVFINAEVGYQLGFQKLNGAEAKSNFAQIGLGLGIHL